MDSVVADGRAVMSDKNKNMDNEQTIYIPESNISSGTQDFIAANHRNGYYPPGNKTQQGESPQTPPNVYGTQQARSPQTPPNVYGTQPARPPQMPHNVYGTQPARPSHTPPNMYGFPTGYSNPGMQQTVPPVYGKVKKKGNAAVVILVTLIVAVICAIIGISAFIVLQDRDDDNDDASEKRHHGETSSSEEYAIDNDDKDIPDRNDPSDSTEPPTETVLPAESAETTVREPKLILTPNVQGADSNQAAQRLSEAGFMVKIARQYSSDPENTVISQNIAAGTNVAEGTEILLTISQGPEPVQEIVVPDVRGRTFEDARDELQKNGFVVNSAYEESASVAEGRITDQNISPGTKVKKGVNITVTVSTGSGAPSSEYKHGKVVTKETDLNVRKGPGKEYEIAGTVAKDSTVEIVSAEGDWYMIVFKNSYGYVAKSFIQLVD